MLVSEVLALARESDIPVREESFSAKFLDEADEVFATNSLIEVSPVVTWGHERKITTRLQNAYQEVVARELSKPGP